MDKGPWTVNTKGTAVSSGDFDLDVELKITGDFGDTEVRRRYAEWLAQTLNDAATPYATVRLTPEQAAVVKQALDILKVLDPNATTASEIIDRAIEGTATDLDPLVARLNRIWHRIRLTAAVLGPEPPKRLLDQGARAEWEMALENAAQARHDLQLILTSLTKGDATPIREIPA